MRKVRRNCLVCDHGGTTCEPKEEYKEVDVCPECNGAFVDVWIINKYMEKDWKPNREVQRQLHDASVQDAVDALVSAQFTRKSADEMAEGLIALARANTTLDQDSEVKRPLLSIELQDESSVPKVIYKGEEVKYKRNVFLDWDTDTDECGGLTYAIEHMETGNKYPVINRIERQVEAHATD